MSDTARYPRPPFPPQETGPPPGLENPIDPAPRFRAPEYQAAGKLAGLVALITGGDSGIGRSVATLFAREGADVAIGYLDEEQADAEETARVIREQNRNVVLVPGDVKDPQVCEQIVERTIAELGRLDILVNNAAFQNHQDKSEDVTIEQWDKTFRTNIYGYFYMVKAALKHMTEGATIINTGSNTGLDGSAGLVDYASTKGAIHAFTKSLAQQLAGRRIRVNCVAPGPV